jgi:hypothetical protein
VPLSQIRERIPRPHAQGFDPVAVHQQGAHAGTVAAIVGDQRPDWLLSRLSSTACWTLSRTGSVKSKPVAQLGSI